PEPLIQSRLCRCLSVAILSIRDLYSAAAGVSELEEIAARGTTDSEFFSGRGAASAGTLVSGADSVPVSTVVFALTGSSAGLDCGSCAIDSALWLCSRAA